MKHIQIETFAPSENNKALVIVKAQTHRNATFGENGSNSFTASNGIVLISNKYPARDKDKSLPAAKKIYVRGYDTAKDSNTFGISTKKLPLLVQAVKEYNAYFSDAAIFARNLEAAIKAENARREAARKAEAERQARLIAERAAAAVPAGVRIVGYKQIVG